MSLSDPLYDPTDRDVPEYYCIHGTFIGNPYGADYMCGWCEDGTPFAEYELCQTIYSNRRIRKDTAQNTLATMFDAIHGAIPLIPAQAFGVVDALAKFNR